MTRKLKQLTRHLMNIQNILLDETSYFEINVERFDEKIHISLKEECLSCKSLEPISKYCVDNELDWYIRSKKHSVTLSPFLQIQIGLATDNI